MTCSRCTSFGPTLAYNIALQDVDAFSDQIAIVAARKQIEDEITRLESLIRASKSRHNSLSPIFRLPPEILSSIFLFYASCRRACAGRESSLEWIKVSHVCSYWRTVALNCSSLWSGISFLHPKWVNEMIKRSQSASLDIRADLQREVLPELKLVPALIPRTRTLDVTACVDIMDSFVSTMTCSAPLLHSLSLDSLQDFHELRAFTIPENLFNGITPHLRHLKLSNCKLGWDSETLLEGLTHLRIDHIPSSCRPTTTQLVAALRNIQSLESLRLHDCLPPVPENVTMFSPATHPIDMCHLTSLDIKATAPEYAGLMSHISPRAITNTKLKLRGTVVTGHNFSSVLKVLATFVVCLDDPIQNLVIWRTKRKTLLVQGWTGMSPDMRTYAPPQSLSIDLTLSWQEYGYTKAATIMAAVRNILPLTELRFLRMSFIESVSAETWLDAFGSLPKLHNVYSQGDLGLTLISALRELEPVTVGLEKPAEPAPRMYFPALQNLLLGTVNFQHEEGFIYEVGACLKERFERGAKVQELILRDCFGLAGADIKFLKQNTSCVDWDAYGIEQPYGEAEEGEECLMEQVRHFVRKFLPRVIS